ncbi:MAG: phosphodiesterase [Desulfobacterales bacterium]|nr:MAG: phosphodiesterase [Desulfobacterales bacterium]
MLIAQISDFHLKPAGTLAYDRADTATSLRRAVDHINTLNPRPDLVLVTGDLVDEGASESYSMVKKLLTPLIPPVYIVPGNHDHKAELRRTFPDHVYLNQTVAEGGKNYICFTIEDFPVRIIGLDTVTPGDHGGGLGPTRLAWLDETLSERPEAPTVIFMHHPPFASAIGHMDMEIFTGRKEFAAVISKNPHVERVLCGHVHRPVIRRFAGTIASISPGIGMQLVLDLRQEAPSAFILEPPAVMLHLWTHLWDEPTLLTHISIIEDQPGQYSGPYPFFGVVSPK